MGRRLSFADRSERPPQPPVYPDGSRPPRVRPRDPDEAEALTKLVVASREESRRSGRLVRLGPRRYEYHLVSLREDDE
jgi:hypothetical protein